jgi:hypothetical protein
MSAPCPFWPFLAYPPPLMGSGSGTARQHLRRFAVIPLQYGDPEAGLVYGPVPTPRNSGNRGVAERNHRMPQQPELTSHPLPANPASQPGVAQAPVPASAHPTAPGSAAAHEEHVPQLLPRWLEQVELFVRVLLLMCLGMFIFCLPWWPALWDFSPLFLRFPALAHYATQGAVRGLVSGLGLLNLWIAFHDAVRHGTDKT